MLAAMLAARVIPGTSQDMSEGAGSVRRRAVTAVLVLLGTAAFAAAYGQAPLYYSNQNQYFLHGLAEAGYGSLSEDWLARTSDPTPIFSALVASTARFLHPAIFYVYYGLLQAVYAAAMLGQFAMLAGPEMTARRWPIFLALLVVVHSGFARSLSYQAFGLDYPWYLQSGVAGQYVLGAMLQPSVFGVGLIVAIYLFVTGRHFAAAICTALVPTLHFTYALPAAFVTAGFLAALLAQRGVRTALALGAVTLALVAPVTLYNWIQFGPSSAETFAQAQEIMANLRIPHHARIDLWLDWIAGVQIGWIGLSLVLAWRTPLFPVLAVPAGLAALLTIVQAATGSQALALLFPWRVSAVLVPIATTVIVSRLVMMRGLPQEREPLRIMSTIACAVLAAAAGIWICTARLAFGSGEEELDMMNFVKASQAPGQVYLVPVRIPRDPVRGSKSGDFQPTSDRKRDPGLIPLDLQRFRLYTGTPIFVDFKSVPYKDIEVIEWRDRLLRAEGLHEKLQKREVSQALAEMRRQGITHVIEPAGKALDDLRLEPIYKDNYYWVYRISGP
jgi:hypothetical protein